MPYWSGIHTESVTEYSPLMAHPALPIEVIQMKPNQIDAIIASFDSLPNTAVVPKPAYCKLAHRSSASADRDIASGIVDSVLIGSSRRIIVGSIRKLLSEGSS